MTDKQEHHVCLASVLSASFWGQCAWGSVSAALHLMQRCQQCWGVPEVLWSTVCVQLGGLVDWIGQQEAYEKPRLTPAGLRSIHRGGRTLCNKTTLCLKQMIRLKPCQESGPHLKCSLWTSPLQMPMVLQVGARHDWLAKPYLITAWHELASMRTLPEPSKFCKLCSDV